MRNQAKGGGVMRLLRSTQGGLALGPILFIIAILATLAGVLAKSTGVFSSASGSEKARLAANALIEQANQMRLGVERMTANGAVVGKAPTECSSFDQNAPELYLDWVSGVATCANWGQYALFDRLGGAVTRPIPPSEALPQANLVYAARAWQFTKNADIQNMGRDAGDFVAAIEVTLPVCVEINDILYNTGRSGTKDQPPILAAATDITLVAATGADGLIDVANAGTTAPEAGSIAASSTGATFSVKNITAAAGATVGVDQLRARREGCVSNGDGTPRYFYYSVLNAR